MGTGKKKIPIKRITNEKSRMVTFSKRRKGLFKINKEVESKTSSRVASVVFSSTGRPYTYGDVDSVIQKHFRSMKLSTSEMNPHQSNFDVVVTDSVIQKHFRSTKLSTSEMNSHQSNSDVVVTGGASGSRSSLTPERSSLRKWVEGIDVEECQNLNQLLLLKEQLEGTREKIGSIEDAQLFEAMFA